MVDKSPFLGFLFSSSLSIHIFLLSVFSRCYEWERSEVDDMVAPYSIDSSELAREGPHVRQAHGSWLHCTFHTCKQRTLHTLTLHCHVQIFRQAGYIVGLVTHALATCMISLSLLVAFTGIINKRGFSQKISLLIIVSNYTNLYIAFVCTCVCLLDIQKHIISS